jgi:hypothetical protein
LIGLCKHITWTDAKKTLKNNPLQTLLGCAQLVGGVALTILGLGIIL